MGFPIMTGNDSAKTQADSSAVSQSGFTYVFFICFVFIFSLIIGSYLDITSKQTARLKEDELIYTGQLYQHALKRYFISHQIYPQSLGLLLCDGVSYPCNRYLRQLYPDPITGKSFNTILNPQGGIIGVSSTSKMTIINLVWADQYHATKYSDVQFIAN